MRFSLEPFQKKVDKPWGYEIIYTPEGLPYTGKVLVVKPGKRSSIHYHEVKRETLFLFSGSVLLWLEDETGIVQKIPMELFKGYTMQPGQKHRYEALEVESFIMESSEEEKGTTIRVEDDAERPNETEELRQQPNRGWVDQNSTS